MSRPITSLLIANRGEIACRIARTCRQMGIATIAVYADGDRNALHVQVADHAVPLGGVTAAETYLDVAKLIAAAQASGADAVHPGYGFLAERADFARAVLAAGLVWVGPPAAAIASMGDKIAAKQSMESAGVPVLPSVSDPGDADGIGFPLIVKATAGGGGKGMRIVRQVEELEDAVAGARREAASAFGDDRVFLERFVERPRHIEVQIFADVHGNVVHLGERECSVQRRHQKVIEESPSPAVDDATRERLGNAAVAAARAVDYVGAGTVEFVATQPSVDVGPEFFFLEMNTRLQVEHPVTELAWAVDGAAALDLVRLQLEVAEGTPLPFAQGDVRLVGHAVEARLYAEDPASGFLPSTGPVELLVPADGPGTRWDTGVQTGDIVGPHFDPMLAKVIASGPTRQDAIRRLVTELARTRLHGLTTNRDALVAMLRRPEFMAGEIDTGFIAAIDPSELLGRVSTSGEVVHLAAAVLVGRRRRGLERAVQKTIPVGWRNNRSQTPNVSFEMSDGRIMSVAYSPGATRDQWLVEVEQIDVAAVDLAVTVQVVRIGREWIDVEVEGQRLRVAVTALGAPAPQLALTADDEIVWGVDSVHGATRLRQLPRFPAAAQEEVAGSLIAPMPGAVVRLVVEVGQSVTSGDLVMVLEAMKMEHQVLAPADGVVAVMSVELGTQVEAGDTLAVIV